MNIQTDNSKKLQSSATKTYVMALSLVASLSILAYFMMHEVIISQKTSAAVINVSGRQRMLSQRISLFSEYLHKAYISDEKKIKEELLRVLDLFEKSHKELSLGSERLGQPIAPVKELYFKEPQNLNKDVSDFVAQVRAFVDTRQESKLTKIRKLQDAILPKLDSAVKMNQAESEKQVSKLQFIDTMILFFTLSLLLAEAFFIFGPMVKSLASLLKSAIEAKEKAIKATDAKSAFLATVSHEIRSPLTGVLGITETLLDSELPAANRDQVRILGRLTESLVSLVNDILDYSKIEAGQLTLEEVDFGMSSLVLDTNTLFQASAEKKGITLKVEMDPSLPPVLVGDPTRLRQVVTNFISNALKFTPTGGSILVKFKCLSSSDSMIVLKVTVQDSGIGITPEAQAKLFNRYVQTDTSVSRKYGGTGLGLFISKQIVELLKGQIGVDSEENLGSTFWFEIPLKKSSNVIVDIPRTGFIERPQNWASGYSVLLAEDNEVNQKVLTTQLSQIGFSVSTANNGSEAVRLSQIEKFDLILMDCEMPGMDGFEASKEIRRLQKGGSPIVILALTGHPDAVIRTKCLEAGMNDVVTKPIRKAELSIVLQKWFAEIPEKKIS